jgi:hypothetical protein
LKKIIFILIFYFLSIATIAQELKKVETLDSIFAGIPLKRNFEKWIEHINTHPFLGIDSTGKQGIYSSYKSGIKSHFPFPDSIKVKLKIYSALNIDSCGQYSNDTIKIASLEGNFGNNKKAKKLSSESFKYMKLLLKNYYKTVNEGGVFEDAAGFINGINENFPDVMLFRGYNEEKHFYYILLICEFRQRMSIKISIKNN